MPNLLTETNPARHAQLQAALERLRANPRVSSIRIAAPGDCALGEQLQGVYARDNVPQLPAQGCSRPGGCICVYEPILSEIYP